MLTRYAACRYTQALIIIIFAYCVAQCYVVYMNTQHLFGQMSKMPMCPVCVAAENPYPLATTRTAPPIPATARLNRAIPADLSPKLVKLPLYHSRAPPSLRL